MRPGEAEVTRKLLRDLGRVASHSLREIAAWCGTSDATVVRACRSAGFDGYQDLKYRVLREFTTHSRSRAASGRTEAGSSDEFAGDLAASLSSSRHAIPRAASIISGCRRIIITGSGASMGIGMILTDVLFALKLQALPVEHEQQLQFALTAPTTGVCLIAISHSGETRFPIDAVRQSRLAGIPTIGLSNEPSSELARSVDVYLPTQTVERPEGSFSIAPRVCQLAVLGEVIQSVKLKLSAKGRRNPAPKGTKS